MNQNTNTKKKNLLLVSLVGSLVLVTMFSLFKLKALKGKLDATEKKVVIMTGKKNDYDELLRIDSLVAIGDYDSALKAYSSHMSNKDIRDASGVKLRIDIAEKLLKLERNRPPADFTPAQKDSLDSIQNSRFSSFSKEIRQYDSLNFILEKAKVELANMKRQLKKKSFGEYITFTNKKGSQFHYVGEIKNKKANGYGIALLNTGSRYEGEWKDNERHGEGNFYWADGEHYSGSYVNDQRNGKGTYYWPNGEKYVGQWKDDKRNGEGVFYGEKNEVVTKGIWEDDKLVKEDK